MKLKHPAYFLLIGFFLLTSCDQLFLNVKGVDAKIQGKWQLKIDPTVYYNFQGNLFQYQKYLQKDTLLSVNGYYTFYNDSIVQLKLLPKYTTINYKASDFSLDFLEWDTIHSTSGVDTLVQVFRLKKIDENELNLLNETKNYLFQKF